MKQGLDYHVRGVLSSIADGGVRAFAQAGTGI
jgi:hypothetical protein